MKVKSFFFTFFILSGFCLLGSDCSLKSLQKNLLLNSSFQPGRDRFPMDWCTIQMPEERERHFVCKQGPDKNTHDLSFRPGESGTIYLDQCDIRLNPGRTYRIGAEFNIKALKCSTSGMVMKNSLSWASDQEAGLKNLPRSTRGWQRLEKTVILPELKKNSWNVGRGYTFSIFIGNFQGGELSVRNPYLLPVDEAAAANTAPALRLSSLGRITPVSPLLSQIDIRKPRMTFYFNDELPEDDSWLCRTRIRMAGEQDFTAPDSFPLKRPWIKTRLPRIQTPGRGELKVEIFGQKSRRILVENTYPIQYISSVALTRPPEKRLNMLVSRLLTMKIRNGSFLFSNPRDGWIYLKFSGASNSLKARLDDGKELVLHKDGRHRETLRNLSRGDHQLHLSGAEKGRLIINSIPEILTYSYPMQLTTYNRSYYETYHPDFVQKYNLPVFTSYNCPFPPSMLQTPSAYQEALRAGKHWYMMYVPDWKFETSDEMARRFSSFLQEKRWSGVTVHGGTYDELHMGSYLYKWIYARALWKTLDHAFPIYTWISGPGWQTDNLNADLFSAIMNHGNGRGRILQESYAFTQENEQEAREYLQKLLNGKIRNLGRMIPDAPLRTIIINGGYTNAGNLCFNAYAGPDVKYFWDIYMWKLANEKDFRNLAGVGLYCPHCGNEETIRWHLRLLRHYALEGQTESLAQKYGYTYLPGFIHNGDFDQDFTDWQKAPAEKNSISIQTIPQFGMRYQQRLCDGAGRLGTHLCKFTGSQKAPNRLSQTMTGFTPGKIYVLRFVSSDAKNYNAQKKQLLRNPLYATFEGAEDITAESPAARFLRSSDGINLHPGKVVNNHTVVFKALKEKITVTFSDWQNGKPPRNPSAILFNFVNITPYYQD